MSRPRQILPRRLELILERIDLAKESFPFQSPEWLVLEDCQRRIKELISAYKATNAK